MYIHFSENWRERKRSGRRRERGREAEREREEYFRREWDEDEEAQEWDIFSECIYLREED